MGYDEEYAKRNINGKYGLSVSGNDNSQIRSSEKPITAPATPEAEKWDGWGTALKPAHEPIVMARKPFKGPCFRNVLEHGTGAINIDDCRVGVTEQRFNKPASSLGNGKTMAGGLAKAIDGNYVNGRWPANLIHDGSDEVIEQFPESNGGAHPKKANKRHILQRPHR